MKLSTSQLNYLAQRKSDIMSAARKVIRGDSRKIWVLVAALEKFPASCLIARRMREELINGINEFHDYKMLFYMYNTARVQPAAHLTTTTTSPATPGIYFSVMQCKHHVAISLYAFSESLIVTGRQDCITTLATTPATSLATTIPAGTVLHCTL